MPRLITPFSVTLDTLAGRVRASGLCLMLLKPGGQLAFHDEAAGDFFTQSALPLIQASDEIRRYLTQVTTASGVSIFTGISGLSLAAFPYLDRRQVAGVFLLAAKADEIDGQSLSCQADLFAAMVRDQLQLSQFQSEMDGLSHQLANTYEELSLIYQISSGMRINRRAGEFFKRACLDLLNVLGVKGIGVALCGDHAARQEPVLYGQMNLPAGTLERLAEELTPVLCLRNAPVLINDPSSDPAFAWLSGNVRRILAVPMQRQDEVLGCYFAMDKEGGDFDSQDSKLLNSIANESAIFLENAMLYDDVHGLMMGLLHSLTSAVDAKDAYTHGHSERVAALSRQLTLEAGLGEQLAERIYLAGLLHDVGKIGVPESVLHKTGRLTPEEFDQMKKHPQIGAHILADVKQIRDLIPGVMHHHERYDGNGYPFKLSGENIPLMGRVICLADCFDAMTSNRTYRKALPLEVALMEIRRCGGTQFDPSLTEAFLRIGVDRLRELVVSPQKLAAAAADDLQAA